MGMGMGKIVACGLACSLAVGSIFSFSLIQEHGALSVKNNNLEEEIFSNDTATTVTAQKNTELGSLPYNDFSHLTSSDFSDSLSTPYISHLRAMPVSTSNSPAPDNNGGDGTTPALGKECYDNHCKNSVSITACYACCNLHCSNYATSCQDNCTGLNNELIQLTSTSAGLIDLIAGDEIWKLEYPELLAENADLDLLEFHALSSPDLAHRALAAAMLADYAAVRDEWPRLSEFIAYTLREDEHVHLRRTALAIVQDHAVLLDDERVASAVAFHMTDPVLGNMAARALQ